MRKILVFSLIFALLFTIGCMTSHPNQNLKMNEPAIFEGNGNAFSASIDHVEVTKYGSYLHNIIVYISIKNTGNQAISLVAYTGLTDYAGVKHNGGSTAFGLIYPGNSATSHDGYSITSEQEYQALLKGSTIGVTFYDDKINPYSASWILDFNNI